MKFVDIIVANSQIKEAKLYGPSKKASEKPETGIVIQNAAAFHVIKDCATLANQYLPHFIFGHYANPFEVLKSKFTKADISEFINGANSDIVLNQLLVLILEKARKVINTNNTTQPSVTPAINVNANDPYGEYEIYSEQPQVSTQLDTYTILCTVFNALE